MNTSLTITQTQLYYAGIGSRSAPDTVLQDIRVVGYYLATHNYGLRSGGADGCDITFEHGCDIAKGSKQIFLPWKSFNKNNSPWFNIMEDAHIIASQTHPTYKKLSKAARALIARNMHQILGPDLNDPVQFVICWTPDGCEKRSQYSQRTGGTGSAIALADKWEIPVYNLKNYTLQQLLEKLQLCHGLLF